MRFTSAARGEVNDIAKVLANLLLNPSNSVSAAESDLKEMKDRGVRYLDQVKDRADTASEHQLVDRVNNAWDAYTNYATRVTSLMSQNRVEDANNYRNSTGLAVQKEAVDSLNACLDIRIRRSMPRSMPPMPLIAELSRSQLALWSPGCCLL